ncbi:MAG: hypothetical protein ABJB11_16505 [Ferruginibacter sp.]
MKKIFLLLMLIPIIGISQQNVVSSSRYFPKMDKTMEFEKALTAHVQKFHSGDWKWRVYEIQTGPDAGGYHVVEGAKSWDEFDKRGNLGAEHTNDWNKNVSIYLTDKYSSTYSEFQEELSTTQLGNFTDKITITHIFPRPGMGGAVSAIIKKAKKAWAAGNQTVAVYQSVASGPTQFALVYRLKDGLKELAEGYRKPFKERYEAANGEGTTETLYQSINKNTDSSWSEMLFFRPDLSAK